MKSEYFSSLKNAPNLTTLSIKRLKSLKVYSLSDYLNDELPSVTSLDLSGYVNASDKQSLLENLNGIEKFTNLKTLTVNYTSRTLDISAIKNCPTLTTVNLSYCNIQSISGIEGLTNLQSLTLNDNSISALKPLENLTKLAGLNLENNAISDTSSYVDVDGTTKTYNNLEILANLNKNGSLERLYIDGNDNIIDFSPISRLSWSNKTGF